MPPVEPAIGAATRVAAPLGGTPGGTYGGDERYRAYDATTVRRRNWWPWVIAAGAIIAVVVGGWFLYDNVQKQISENKPVTVQQYTGIVESKAVNLIIQDGLEPKVQRVPSPDQPVGIVFEQSPVEGTSLAKGGIVTIKVSTGKKTVDAPDVVGKQLTDAVAALTRAGLNAKSVGVPSDKPSGTSTVFLPVETLIVTIPPLARLVPSIGDCSNTIPTGWSPFGVRCTFGSNPSAMIKSTALLSTMPVYCCTVTGLFSLIWFWTLS